MIDRYTGRPIRTGRKGIEHGLGGHRLNNNASIAPVLGSLLEQALPLNKYDGNRYVAIALANGADGGKIVFFMIDSATNELEGYDAHDFLHSYNGKKKNPVLLIAWD